MSQAAPRPPGGPVRSGYSLARWRARFGPDALVAGAGRYGIPAFGILVAVFFSALRPDTYGTLENFRAILDTQVVVVFVALAIMLPMVVGEFDLSVAAVATLVATLVVGLPGKQHLGVVASIVVALLPAPLIGLVNGLLVVRFRISAFVVTLGTSTLLAGIWLAYLDGKQYLPASIPDALTGISRDTLLGLPRPLFYAAITAALLWFFFAYVRAGRRMQMAGSNRAAARLVGIRPERYLVASFVGSALLAGVAGLILGTELGSIYPGEGLSLLLPGFAAVFLGATTIDPGRFNVLGTVVAVYAVAFLVSGLQQLGLAPWATPLLNGVALLLAVALSTLAIRARQGRARRLQLEILKASVPAEGAAG